MFAPLFIVALALYIQGKKKELKKNFERFFAQVLSHNSAVSQYAPAAGITPLKFFFFFFSFVHKRKEENKSLIRTGGTDHE